MSLESLIFLLSIFKGVLTDSPFHFLYSGGAALLAFWSMSIMYASYSTVCSPRFTQALRESGADFYIRLLIMSLCAWCAVSEHLRYDLLL